MDVPEWESLRLDWWIIHLLDDVDPIITQKRRRVWERWWGQFLKGLHGTDKFFLLASSNEAEYDGKVKYVWREKYFYIILLGMSYKIHLRLLIITIHVIIGKFEKIGSKKSLKSRKCIRNYSYPIRKYYYSPVPVSI